MLAVTKVTPLDGLILHLEFNDGSAGDVDCSFLADKGLGVALRDAAFFCQVSVDEDSQTIVWPNGLDPAPELLRSRLGSVSSAAA